jgi:LmbE family N-acetylglucosaminyl deacetylase
VTEAAISMEELARPERHLFVSPHYDDIALSVGGTAALLSRQGREPVIALLFGSEPDPGQLLTSFAESMHRQWGMDASEVIAGRREEEAAATAILGARDKFAPFHDAIYRGERYLSDTQLFGTPNPDEADLPGQIIEALGLDGRPDGAARVYAPLGIGTHVDHQLAFAAGIELAQKSWEVWFYEDLPYVLRPGSRESRFAAIGHELAVAAIVDVEDVWKTKLDAIMAYPSQLAVVFSYVRAGHSREEIDEVMSAYAREAGGGYRAERFWKLT